MAAPDWRTGSRRAEPESGVFARGERRAEPPPRRVTPLLTKHSNEEGWIRLSIGLLSIAAFVAAGFMRLCVDLTAVVYLLVVTTALVVFGGALLLPDGAFRVRRHHDARTVARPRGPCVL